MTNFRPQGFQTITPSLAFQDAKKAIAFYEKAFGAKTETCMSLPDGRIMHAELAIGTSKLFLADEMPNFPVKEPTTVKGALTGSFYLYVEDCDAFLKKAEAAGAKVSMPPENMFWGDRLGALTDPFGHSWTIATHVEDPSPAEMEKRRKEWLARMAQGPKKLAV